MNWAGVRVRSAFGPLGAVPGPLAAVGNDGVGAADDLVGELAQHDVGLFALGLDVEPVALFFDEEVVEEREVAQAPFVFGQLVVADASAVDQSQGFVECLHDVVDLDEGDLLPAFDFGVLVLDAGLFLLHDLDRDAVAVVELEQLFLLVLEVFEPAGVPVGFVASDRGLGLHRRLERLADKGELIRRQPRLGVDALQFFFDLCEAEVADAARPCGRDAAEAGVVLVVLSGLAAVAAVAEVLVAALAGQLAAEVVLVLAAAAAAGALRSQDRLDALEGRLVDDLGVQAGQGEPASRDHAGVVVAGQQPVDG